MVQPLDPRASSRNTVIFGKARFTLLTPRMARFEYASDGAFEDRASLMVSNRRTPPVKFTAAVRGSSITIATGSMSIVYRNDGRPFSAANLAVSFKNDGKAKSWHPGMKDNGNLGGTLRTLDCMEADRYVTNWHPLEFKKKVNLPSGLVSRNGWSLVDDSSGIVLQPMDDGRPWVAKRQPGTRRDWYFLAHGRDYVGALADAQQMFGRQPLPPRFSLGYWWSRYWAYTDVELKELVTTLDRMGVPLDVLIVDMDWHKDGWTGYSWDRNYFPHPDDFMSWVKKQGLKLALNLHPAEGVGNHEDQFAAMARAMKADPKKTKRIPFDCVDPKFMDAYFKVLHHPMEDNGIDFWWMDWQQGEKTKLEGLDPLVWLNRLHWEDMEKRDPAKRPLIFSRFGGIGSGRYPIGFSGDTLISWDSLAYQPYFTATAANVLYGYWSHDIGGHAWAAPNGQLYLRWLQFGCYSPVLRTHATKTADNDRRYWLYGEPYATLMIETIRKRYELVPYLYTENRKAMDTGVSPCHPLYYNHPDEPAAYEARNEYYFGEQMLVAPVTVPVNEATSLASVGLWLPKGTWIDTATGEPVEGGRQTREYTFWDTPVFVRPGTVICGQPVVDRLMPGSYPTIVVTAYPGAKGEYTLYEDDGVSQEYRNGRSSMLSFTYKKTSAGRTIRMAPARGRFKGFLERRALEIRLPLSAPPLKVKAGNKTISWKRGSGPTGWNYDGDNATVVIRIAGVSATKGVTVTIRDNPAIPARTARGIKGMIVRAKAALEVAHGAASSEIDRDIARFAQLGNRLSYDPSLFGTEVPGLKQGLARLERACRKFSEKPASDPEPDRQARHRATTRRVTALVAAAKDCLD